MQRIGQVLVLPPTAPAGLPACGGGEGERETDTAVTVDTAPAPGAAFHTAYVQWMVQSHTTTPNTIDTQLRAARNQEVRPAVSMHLEQARQLQGSPGSR